MYRLVIHIRISVYLYTKTGSGLPEAFIRPKKILHNDPSIQNYDGKLYVFVVKSQNQELSTTNHTPIEAHKDNNSPDVISNLAIKAKYKRKYNNTHVGDTVKIYAKGANNYTYRKETVSRWSNHTYIIKVIDRDVPYKIYYV